MYKIILLDLTQQISRMPRILIQFMQYKFLYNQETNLEDIKAYIQEDLKQLSQEILAGNKLAKIKPGESDKFEFGYELVFIDQNNGDWMMIEQQKDFDNISAIMKDRPILLKVLPKNKDSDLIFHQDLIAKSKKIPMTSQMMEFVQQLSKKHEEKMLKNQRNREHKKKLKEKYRRVSEGLIYKSMPEECNFSEKRLKIPDISANVINNFQKTKPNKQFPIYIQPKQARIIQKRNSSKNNYEEQIIKIIKEKIDTIVPIISDKVAQKLNPSFLKCNKCQNKQLQFDQVIIKSLIRKIKAQSLNPEDY